MESSSSSFSNDFSFNPEESSLRKGRTAPRKRLTFYLFFQFIILAASISVGFLHGFSPGTGSTFSLLVLLLGGLNFILLSERKLLAYRLEYFRILLTFVLIISFLKGSAEFRDFSFLASLLTFFSFLWLKVIRPIFRD